MSTPVRRAQTFDKHREAPSFTFSMPRIAVGPRLLSFFIAIFCFVDMYLMLTSDPFIVYSADIQGNKQVSSQEIQNVLRIADLPAAYLNPDQIQANILGAFPNISNAQVDIYIPNSVVISVEERTPVVAWHQQDGQVTWVDADGYGFAPHGQIDNLPSITALGTPPAPAIDPTQTIGAKPFLQTDLSQAIMTISPYLPKGAALIFDPQYGLGWSDPQGWKVYFGYSNKDSALKLQVYQSMLDYLSKKNIKPTMISVEYPNAPFYQAEQ
jgi:cell division protein FtsQ